MFSKISVENALVEADFKQKPATESQKPTSYATLKNITDVVSTYGDKYTFLNGQDTGSYESHLLEKLELPGINDRFKMPKKETRKVAERESDTGIIISNCFSDASPRDDGLMYVNQVKRLTLLKYFEKLLQSENPERTYDFLDRNYMEQFDAKSFRQQLTNAIRLKADINTAYFDKDDALLLAINFKNPPGRLLRRQWTHPLRVLPDIDAWRAHGKNELLLQDNLLNIPYYKVGMIRTNQKFCFPCDNGVIRIDKNQVGGRRFGTSVIVKDNLIFGIKETQKKVDEKIDGEDEMLSMEAARAADRRCELWCEFENGVRMEI